MQYYSLLCACGCMKKIEIKPWHKYYGIPKFIHGHQTRCITEETKRKMSESKKGIKQSEETKEKRSIALKGKSYKELHGREKAIVIKNKIRKKQTNRIVSEETKMKMRKSRKKRIITEETKEKMRGENNPAWKGGISCEPYCDVWMDQEFKQSIKDRDNNRCINPDCWKTSIILNIHHINYVKKDCHPFNLITLCASCNTRANKDREWHKSWYEAIIYNKYKMGQQNEFTSMH